MNNSPPAGDSAKFGRQVARRRRVVLLGRASSDRIDGARLLAAKREPEASAFDDEYGGNAA